VSINLFFLQKVEYGYSTSISGQTTQITEADCEELKSLL